MILRSRRFGSPLAMEESPGIVVARSSRSNRASALSTAERRARFEASESENSRAVGQASRSALHSEKAAAPAATATTPDTRQRRANEFIQGSRMDPRLG